VYLLDPELEARLAEAVVDTPHGPMCLPDPADLRVVLEGVRRASDEMTAQGHTPVLLTSAPIRRHVRALVARSLPELTVLSHAEVVPEVRVRALGSIALEPVAA